MALNTFKCNYLTPLHFKGLTCLQALPTQAVSHSIVAVSYTHLTLPTILRV